MTVKYYNDQSPGMPTLSDAAGSLINLLDVVLPLLGWTVAYTGTSLRAYRNDSTIPGSSGCYVRVDNVAAAAKIRVYKTMSAISTGTEPIPTSSTLPNGIRVHPLGAQWEIIGDERTFYFSCYSDDNYQKMIWGCGDYDSAVPGNTSNYFNFGPYDDGSWAWSGFTQTSFGDNQRWIARDSSGTINTPTQTAIYTAFGSSAYSGGSSYFLSESSALYGAMYGAAYLVDPTQYQFVGKLRGCFYSMNSYDWNTPYLETTIVPAGHTLPLRFFQCGTGSGTGVLLAQDNW